jgi:hypothetical protein
MAIRRAKIASVADGSDVAQIQPSDLDPEAVPGTPADGDVRTERTGTTPTRYIRVYVYDSSAWQLVSEIVI